MRDNFAFGRVPLGTEIYDPRSMSIQTVAAHIEGVWAGGNSPWYGALSVPKLPDLEWWMTGEERNKYHLWGTGRGVYDKKKDCTLLAGEWPELYFVHCLNGGSGSSFALLSDIRIRELYGHLHLIRMPFGTAQNLLWNYIEGDSSVGESDTTTAAMADLTFCAIDGYDDEEPNSTKFMLVADYLMNKCQHEGEREE